MFQKIPNIPYSDTDEYNDDLELDELDEDSEISTAGFDKEEPGGWHEEIVKLARTQPARTLIGKVKDMKVAHQTHLPFNLLTLLGQARFGPNLAAERAGALGLGEGVMGGCFGQMQTPSPLGAFAARLLPPASFGLRSSPRRSGLGGLL